MNGLGFSRQRGITLITSMVVLLIVTLLGLASIEDSTLEEKMAGHMRNQNLAFQVAESALREGENYILTADPLPAFDGTNGHYPALNDVMADMAASWATSSARVYTGAAIEALQVAELPLYIVEEMEALAAVPSLEAGKVQDDSRYYRVTARAVGSNSNTVVILQSIVLR